MHEYPFVVELDVLKTRIFGGGTKISYYEASRVYENLNLRDQSFKGHEKHFIAGIRDFFEKRLIKEPEREMYRCVVLGICYLILPTLLWAVTFLIDADFVHDYIVATSDT